MLSDILIILIIVMINSLYIHLQLVEHLPTPSPPDNQNIKTHPAVCTKPKTLPLNFNH